MLFGFTIFPQILWIKLWITFFDDCNILEGLLILGAMMATDQCRLNAPESLHRQSTTADLISLKTFKQRLEVTLAKAFSIIALTLNKFKEYRAKRRL